MRTDSEGRETLDPYLTAASAIGSAPRYVCPMPVWLNDHEYATLQAACAQMLPSSDSGPVQSSEKARVAIVIHDLEGGLTEK